MVAVALREGMSAKQLRQAAAGCGGSNQAPRLLALAAIRDGMSRTAAARIGGMDRQTLRDSVHAFNAQGAEGLINDTSPGRPCKLSAKQKAALKAIEEKGPELRPHQRETEASRAEGRGNCCP
jgi:transposase